jgi:hypothetical protein
VATEQSKQLPNIRLEMKALSKDGTRELTDLLAEADERFATAPHERLLSIFNIEHGGSLNAILRACAAPGEHSTRIAFFLESLYVSGIADACKDYMKAKFGVLLDALTIIRLAFGSLQIKDFAGLIASSTETICTFGQPSEGEQSYKLDLADGGKFTLNTPKTKDLRKFSSLHSAKLCQKALFYFFEILRFMHCPDVNWFAHHQAAGATFFEQLDLQVEGDLEALHLFLERVWRNFCCSLRETARRSLRVDSVNAHGLHVGDMMKSSLCFFDEPDSAWWTLAVDQSRRRQVATLCAKTDLRLAMLQREFSSLQTARPRDAGTGGGGGKGGGGRGGGAGGDARGGGKGGGGDKRGSALGTPASTASGGGAGRSTKAAKRDRAANRTVKDGTSKRLKLDSDPSPAHALAAWAKVELGFAGERLAAPDECRKALLEAGFDNAGAARSVWGKTASNRGLCFWFNSPFGKAGGGCPYPDCKFGPPGHNG